MNETKKREKTKQNKWKRDEREVIRHEQRIGKRKGRKKSEKRARKVMWNNERK